MANRMAPIYEDRLMSSLPSEHRFIVAILRQALTDAVRQACPYSRAWYDTQEARRWLQSRDEVLFWVMLAGLPEGVYERLVKAAGLEETL